MKQATTTITHVIHSGGFYGAERMLVDHCLATEPYIDSSVVLLSPPAALLKRFTDYGIDCVGCDSLNAFVAYTKNRSTIINAHNFKAQIYAWIAARKNRLPLIFTQHGFTPRSVKQHLYMWASLLLCKTSTVKNVVCVAKSIALLHKKFRVADRKIHVIANGLANKPAVTRQETQSSIGFIGRLSMEKGPDLFLQAVIPLLRKNQYAQALFLGDGPLLGVLEDQVTSQDLTEQVQFLGYQDNINSWLSKLSVLVISSRTEGTPMVLLEAMQARLPVVAFNVGGIPDVIRHNKEGLLAPALDTKTLQAQIEKVLTAPAYASELAEHAQQRQMQHYSLEHNAQQWLKVYTNTQESLA